MEEHCRDVEEPSDPEGSEKACDVFPERRHLAAEVCGVLKRGEFKGTYLVIVMIFHDFFLSAECWGRIVSNIFFMVYYI